jgi:hypothetical protein
MKQIKMQWLQDTNQSNVDTINNVWREASRHIRREKKEYLKAKFDVLETNNKIENTRDFNRGINYFKKGYQTWTNIVKDNKGDLVRDSHCILARWKNNFSFLVYMGLIS